MTTTETKTRTITLTGRPPVKIVEEDWPIIASAKHYRGEFESQADRIWRLNVRQHADGRAIVYGTYETRWQGEHDNRAGELLQATPPTPQRLTATILRVAGEIDAPERLAQECIADLPAEEI